MQPYKILWVDDEIDLLKPHILFLEKKGYEITAVNNGSDAIDRCDDVRFDMIFLDENMPGMTGLEVLAKIKVRHPSLPVVMITKNEAEHIMEEAIGSKIDDYLIKPLNPNQILISAKRILENKKLVSQRTNLSYQQDFRNISMAFGDDLDYQEWMDIYRKLVYWELEIDRSSDQSMLEVLNMQKDDANNSFINFVSNHYQDWLEGAVDKPLLSHEILKQWVFPDLGPEPLFLLVIDNLRLDQWKIMEEFLSEYFNVDDERLYYSIVPTTTAYARNALFSGMLPRDMAQKLPQLWVGEDEDEAKNNNEKAFLGQQLRRNRLDIKFSYHKIKNLTQGKALADAALNLVNNDLNAIVYNFVDMLSHARTDMEMIKELAPDESAYRSITSSWFSHSPLFEMLKTLSRRKIKLMITTDHGTIRVKKPYKIVGDRNTNTNLRYKQGKNLAFEESDVFFTRDPESIGLPRINVSTSYVFALQNYFFAYPNNYNYYVKYYTDTFQHGGISMEEMIIPFISLSSKNA
jgi:CheY-like chemotaxis protein